MILTSTNDENGIVNKTFTKSSDFAMSRNQILSVNHQQANHRTANKSS
jgi:hypothetical protein